MELSAILEEAIDKVEKLDFSYNEEDEEDIRQIFPSHDLLSERLRKTLYYGETLPRYDVPSLSFTEYSVERFSRGHLRRLDRLSVRRAAEISREACASPTSLLLALLYLERLRLSNPAFLSQTSSTDVFLVSLMVASKFLNDDGEEDEVFNEYWASSAGMEKSSMNQLEIEFLSAIDWKVFVAQKEFDGILENVEDAIAKKHFDTRGWATYTDLLVLSRKMELARTLAFLYNCAIKVTIVCISAYVASFMTMLGTCYFLNSTPIGPRAVQISLSTLVTRDSLFSPRDLTPIIDEETIDIINNTMSSVFQETSYNFSENLSIKEKLIQKRIIIPAPLFNVEKHLCHWDVLSARNNHCIALR